MSTDNYIEKYLPIKIHKFITSALRNVFDNKKDLKKLKDYEAKRDWLLNEVIQNDDGIPGDFKKAIPEDNAQRVDKVKLQKRSKRPKISSNKRTNRINESSSSIGTNSMLISHHKNSSKKSKRKKSNTSHQSSQFSALKEAEEYNRKMKKVNESISYQNSAQEEERLNKILTDPNDGFTTLEVKNKNLMGDVKIEKKKTEKESPGSFVIKLL